jgi:hypothetical protein
MYVMKAHSRALARLLKLLDRDPAPGAKVDEESEQEMQEFAAIFLKEDCEAFLEPACYLFHCTEQA